MKSSVALAAWAAAEPRRGPPPLDIPALLHPGDWARLPPSLRRRFQARHSPATYQGSLTFECSAVGVAFALLSRVFRAPLTSFRGAEQSVTVHVRTVGHGIAWSRMVGARCIRSVKSAGPGGSVLERTDGGLGMVLDVSVEADALVFTSRRYFLAFGLWRLPIPSLLPPGRCRAEHRAVDERHFHFTLTMVHPLWGTTFRQTGVFTDNPESLP